MAKITIAEYLNQNYAEPVPAWLTAYKPGDPVNMKDVLGSRVVYYPGSGVDGTPVMIFGSSHSAHVFLYVDYGIEREQLEDELVSHGFAGYHELARITLNEKDLIPGSYTYHVSPTVKQIEWQQRWMRGIQPYCFMEILERDADKDDSHGAARLAIIFLFADGIAAYDALFGNKVYPAPFAIDMQDHGWGGNYDKFGKDGLMNRCARITDTYPQLLFLSDNTPGWDGYVKIDGVHRVMASSSHALHALMKRI